MPDDSRVESLTRRLNKAHDLATRARNAMSRVISLYTDEAKAVRDARALAAREVAAQMTAVQNDCVDAIAAATASLRDARALAARLLYVVERLCAAGADLDLRYGRPARDEFADLRAAVALAERVRAEAKQLNLTPVGEDMEPAGVGTDGSEDET